MRLRPIVMTKLTCIVGLVPLMLFGGPLWTGMAIAMIGGMASGTLVTLGLISVLYDLLFSLRQGVAGSSREGGNEVRGIVRLECFWDGLIIFSANDRV